MRKIKCYRYCYEEDNKVKDGFCFATSKQSVRKQVKQNLILINEVEFCSKNYLLDVIGNELKGIGIEPQKVSAFLILIDDLLF